jgi:nucleolar MIF4G domain-containing protein 1
VQLPALVMSTSTYTLLLLQVMTTLIPPYAALISALNIAVGREVGAHVLEAVARKLHAVLEQSDTATTAAAAAVASKQQQASQQRCPASNLTLLLAYLYAFGVAHCSLLYDIVRLLLARFGELEVELLLLLLQHCGFQLRSDDPDALKQVVQLVSVKAGEVIAAKGSSGGHTDRYVVVTTTANRTATSAYTRQLILAIACHYCC